MIFISFIHCSFTGYDRIRMGEIFHLEHWKEPYILGTIEVLHIDTKPQTSIIKWTLCKTTLHRNNATQISLASYLRSCLTLGLIMSNSVLKLLFHIDAN